MIGESKMISESKMMVRVDTRDNTQSNSRVEVRRWEYQS